MSSVETLAAVAGPGAASPKVTPPAARPAKKPARYFCWSSFNGSPLTCLIKFNSVDIALITFIGFQFCHVGLGFIGGFAAGSFDDLVQGVVNILGHAGGIAANIKMRAGIQPG